MQAFLFFSCFVGGAQFVGHAFLAEAVETGDKNRDDFYCMQIRLVMSMRFIFGDDWNNAKCLSRFSAKAKFLIPCKKSYFIFFDKTGLRFMLI